MLKITFQNGKEVDVSKSDIIVGFDNLPATDMNKTYFAVEGYSSFYDDDLMLTTANPKLALVGFLLTHECFAIDEKENKHIYMSTSVKNVTLLEN